MDRLEEVLKRRREGKKGEDVVADEMFWSSERGTQCVWSRGSIGVFREEEDATLFRYRSVSSRLHWFRKKFFTCTLVQVV